MKTDFFDCRFRFEDADLTDIPACRSRMIEIVNDRNFEQLVNDLAVTSKAVKGGPTPRGGGECGAHVSGNSGGGWSVGGGCSWRF
ncbi:hypothetical protein OK349_04795 [Sphingomonas sp. BT-65]|uniref:hypothetical protein n=1 Tax=Sphingomonas sp. BT-65 TaxID=2989821 RepID=UPI002235FD3F|nr:hypothetical protein [Sphingomonas sp. BT-65]MCW4461015.1 hypothetical protein [Sphingomonas sp. BT-65]